MTRARHVYLNPKQKEFMKAPQPLKLFLGGRGSGKTHVMGVNQRAKAGAMPRSKGFIAAATYNQILTKTLPAMINSWSQFGLIEGIHYVIGIRPPKGFDTPISPPKKFANVISWCNGRCIEMVSLDRPDLVRGGSFDDGDIDEAALLKNEHWTKILLPSVRGNRHKFHGIPYHHQVNFYTSIPWKPSGYWILEFEDKVKAYPKQYHLTEATAYDNIHILGEEGIDRMRREMPHTEFQIEVMNERVVKVDDCFYESFDLEKHTYSPNYSYRENDQGLIVTDKSDDYDPKQIIEATWDFGGWFNCMGVWQAKGMTERWIDSFDDRGLDENLNSVVEKFCTKYAGHGNKLIQFWGEPRGHDREPLTPSIYEQLSAAFRRKGWAVVVMVEPGYATRQHVEHRSFVNSILREEDARLPKVRLNEEANRSPIIAIQSTETTAEGKKDKSKEKDRGYPQHHATHYTDGFDYYLMQKHGWRVQDGADAGAGEAFIL